MTEETKVAEATEAQTEEKEEASVAAEEKPDESAPSAGDTEQGEKEASGEEVDEEGKPKRKGGFQRRIDKLTARLHAQSEEAEFWRQKALERERLAPKAETPQVKPKPTQEDFKLADGESYDHAAYTEALTDWKAEEAVRRYAAEQETKAKERDAQTEKQREQAEFQKREQDFADSVEDYEEVTSIAIGTLRQAPGPGSASIGQALFASECGPELLYYLGQNPDEAKRIAQLSPARAMMALGQLEARLAEQEEEKGEETRTPPPVSTAPKPATPIRKPSGASKLRPDDPNDAEKMSAEDWRKARDEQERQRIRAQRGK